MVKPIEYLGEQPPQRIIGTECEYNVQFNTKETRDDKGNIIVIEKSVDLLHPDIIDAVMDGIVPNYAYKDSYNRIHLQNGAQIYDDVRHLEYNTPEARGPYAAAAADFAGMIIMAGFGAYTEDIVKSIYRRTGTDFANTDGLTRAMSSGFHENFSLERHSAVRLIQSPLLPNYLATRSWSFSGMVGRNGYQLSQKAQGVGKTAVSTAQGANATKHGYKPMSNIMVAPTDDQDVNPHNGFSRLEIRYADAGISRWSRFTSLAFTSAVLRLHEHQDKQPLNLDLFLTHPMEAAQTISRDVLQREVFETHSGKQVQALDIQEMLAVQVLQLSEKVSLPKHELVAAEGILTVIDDLRRCDPRNGDFTPVIDAIDWAAKYHYIRNHHKQEDLTSKNPKAVALDLQWDRIYPTGIGMKWWEKIGGRQRVIDQQSIDDLVFNAPRDTRAHTRAKLIKDNRVVTVKWSEVLLDNRRRLYLRNPYTS